MNEWVQPREEGWKKQLSENVYLELCNENGRADLELPGNLYLNVIIDGRSAISIPIPPDKRAYCRGLPLSATNELGLTEHHKLNL